MPSGLDLIGGNPALQEHWIKRFIAVVVDAIVLGVLFFIVNVIAGGRLFLWGWWGTFVFGIFWLLYSVVLEGSSMRGTIGKKVVNLQVVAIDGQLTMDKVLIRNISKIHGLIVLLDWILGFVTQGDPRQRYLDRIARTTVTRVDANAYVEEQFRQMQYVPPRPAAPPAGAWGQPAPQQPAPGGAQAVPAEPAGAPTTGGWPGQTAPPPGGGWPQHQWDEQGQLKPQMRFCTNCGGQLVQRGDGRFTCVRCGAVY